MQIDFHHAMTYAIARLAGFQHSKAVVIAYASQYVDDSVNQGIVNFDNGETYTRIASAHKLWDPANADDDKDYLVWVPFHFLPGNNGRQAGEAIDAPVAQRLVCTEDSPLANELWQECQRRKAEISILHRLGITSHVYCDTFSHQAFAGLRHSINQVSELRETARGLCGRIAEAEGAAANMFEIGHGGAQTCPDQPSLEWTYRNWGGQMVPRDNAKIFTRACLRLFKQFIYFLEGDPNAELETADMAVIESLIKNETNEDGNQRHAAWLAAIQSGRFSFGELENAEASQLQYEAFGEGSWRAQALSVLDQHDPKDLLVRYDSRFETSNWKHFHDALKDHLKFVLSELLPKYGLPGSFAAAKRAGV